MGGKEGARERVRRSYDEMARGSPASPRSSLNEVIGFFDERAVLRDTDQTRMTAGGGSEPPSELSAKNNVATEFRIKGDDRQDRFILAKYGQINPTRMIKHVLSSKFVSDEAKHALCTGRKSQGD